MKKTGMTDYEMQVVLEKRGYNLYSSEDDNQVNNEELADLARAEGYVWDNELELWFMFSREEKQKLKSIYDLFNEIEDIYNSFSHETQEKILEYHNETGSLPHCIRWGIQGTEELMGG